MILGQRIRLDPNNVQASFFERCAGTARFAYNWGLARWQEVYQNGSSPSWQALNAELNAHKHDDLSWLQEVPCAISNVALSDLGSAFRYFFRRVKAGQKAGYPRFKKRGRCREGFAIDARELRFDGRKVRVPKLGWVRVRQTPRFPGRIISARFSKRADHWYLSIQIEIDESQWSYLHRCKTQAVVGIDLGVVELVTMSDGTKIKAPRILRRLEARLRGRNKELSRRKKGGKNKAKTKDKLARLHERIADIRRDAIHKITADIVRRFRWIGIEDLNVSGMFKNRCLAKSVSDASMREVRRQLEYKSVLAGSDVVIADRFYPSSKTCSACGIVCTDLRLGERRWTCNACGIEHDRDINAAKNLEKLAAAHAVTACRQGSAGSLRGVKLPLGQEPGYVNQG